MQKYVQKDVVLNIICSSIRPKKNIFEYTFIYSYFPDNSHLGTAIFKLVVLLGATLISFLLFSREN